MVRAVRALRAFTCVRDLVRAPEELAEESDVLRSYTTDPGPGAGGGDRAERETADAERAGGRGHAHTRRGARRVADAVRASLRRDYEPLYVCASREA